MKIEIDINQSQVDALKREYSKKGLGVNLPGNKPTPLDQVIKQIVEKVGGKR